MNTTVLCLDRESLREGVTVLVARDQSFADIVASHGPPPMWARRPGFPTLVRIILEQQVSLASARAAFGKLQAKLGRVAPGGFLTLDDMTLRALGFSRQKAGYCRELARTIVEKRLCLGELPGLDDATARQQLLALKGIGRWSADIYLLMALRRPDVWPRGDLALAKAVRLAKGLRELPDDERLAEMASGWRPWRAVAARLLWHGYLCRQAAARGR